MPTLFVYLPCYNEAGNLRRLTEEWLAEAEALARTGYQLAAVSYTHLTLPTRSDV